MADEIKELYRVVWRDKNQGAAESYSQQEIEVYFEKLPIIKETPMCWVVKHNVSSPKIHRVLKDQSGKRYAYATKKRAMEAFIIRRQSWARHLRSKVKNNERLLAIANETLNTLKPC